MNPSVNWPCYYNIHRVQRHAMAAAELGVVDAAGYGYSQSIPTQGVSFSTPSTGVAAHPNGIVSGVGKDLVDFSSNLIH